MIKRSPLLFIQQVRNETKKVSWPTKKETTLSTSMVLIMIALTSIFFCSLDYIFAYGIQIIFNLGSVT
jgi:preprotein translocase subunit SecE